MATIKQVAEAAGVKPATVSYVMNGTGSVSAATRQRVRAAAAALHYAPSHLARSLQRRGSRTLGLVLPTAAPDEPIGALLRGLADGAATAGYNLLLAARTEDDDATYADLHRSGRIEGVVILDVRHRDDRVAVARRLGIPYACAGRPGDDSPFVAIDAESGTIEALAHLIVLGHEHIGLITPPLELALATEQDAGYRVALAEAGIAFDEELIVEGGLTEGEGYVAANELLALPEPPTAILAGSAPLAFGTLHAAHDAGMHVGENLALIVFDDPPSAAHVAPPLTAVRQPTVEVGRELAAMLAAVIEGREHQRAVLLPTQLIVRHSCGRGGLGRSAAERVGAMHSGSPI